MVYIGARSYEQEKERALYEAEQAVQAYKAKQLSAEALQKQLVGTVGKFSTDLPGVGVPIEILRGAVEEAIHAKTGTTRSYGSTTYIPARDVMKDGVVVHIPQQKYVTPGTTSSTPGEQKIVEQLKEKQFGKPPEQLGGKTEALNRIKQNLDARGIHYTVSNAGLITAYENGKMTQYEPSSLNVSKTGKIGVTRGYSVGGPMSAQLDIGWVPTVEAQKAQYLKRIEELGGGYVNSNNGINREILGTTDNWNPYSLDIKKGLEKGQGNIQKRAEYSADPSYQERLIEAGFNPKDTSASNIFKLSELNFNLLAHDFERYSQTEGNPPLGRFITKAGAFTSNALSFVPGFIGSMPEQPIKSSVYLGLALIAPELLIPAMAVDILSTSVIQQIKGEDTELLKISNSLSTEPFSTAGKLAGPFIIGSLIKVKEGRGRYDPIDIKPESAVTISGEIGGPGGKGRYKSIESEYAYKIISEPYGENYLRQSEAIPGVKVWNRLTPEETVKFTERATGITIAARIRSSLGIDERAFDAMSASMDKDAMTVAVGAKKDYYIAGSGATTSIKPMRQGVKDRVQSGIITSEIGKEALSMSDLDVGVLPKKISGKVEINLAKESPAKLSLKSKLLGEPEFLKKVVNQNIIKDIDKSLRKKAKSYELDLNEIEGLTDIQKSTVIKSKARGTVFTGTPSDVLKYILESKDKYGATQPALDALIKRKLKKINTEGTDIDFSLSKAALNKKGAIDKITKDILKEMKNIGEPAEEVQFRSLRGKSNKVNVEEPIPFTWKRDWFDLENFGMGKGVKVTAKSLDKEFKVIEESTMLKPELRGTSPNFILNRIVVKEIKEPIIDISADLIRNTPKKPIKSLKNYLKNKPIIAKLKTGEKVNLYSFEKSIGDQVERMIRNPETYMKGAEKVKDFSEVYPEAFKAYKGSYKAGGTEGIAVLKALELEKNAIKEGNYGVAKSGEGLYNIQQWIEGQELPIDKIQFLDSKTYSIFNTKLKPEIVKSKIQYSESEPKSFIETNLKRLPSPKRKLLTTDLRLLEEPLREDYVLMEPQVRAERKLALQQLVTKEPKHIERNIALERGQAVDYYKRIMGLKPGLKKELNLNRLSKFIEKIVNEQNPELSRLSSDNELYLISRNIGKRLLISEPQSWGIRGSKAIKKELIDFAKAGKEFDFEAFDSILNKVINAKKEKLNIKGKPISKSLMAQNKPMSDLEFNRMLSELGKEVTKREKAIKVTGGYFYPQTPNKYTSYNYDYTEPNYYSGYNYSKYKAGYASYPKSIYPKTPYPKTQKTYPKTNYPASIYEEIPYPKTPYPTYPKATYQKTPYPKTPVTKTPPPIIIIPLPFEYQTQRKKKRRIKAKFKLEDLAYIPDFTSKTLDFKIKISEKQFEKELRKKVFTGFEFRKIPIPA